MRRASTRAGRIVAAAALATACATNTAPPGLLPTTHEAPSDAHGGWIELELAPPGGGRSERVEGELLAVTGDSVWVLTTQAGRVIPTAAVKEGKLTGYRALTGQISGYAALGVLSTISNGLLLVFTAPLWVIVGTVQASGESHQPERKVPPLEWQQLALFARFPQGMPDGVRLDAVTRE